MKNIDLPKAPINRIFKKVGGNKMSAEARNMILEDIESYATHFVKDCVDISKHAGRKTVMPNDVKLAQKLM